MANQFYVRKRGRVTGPFELEEVLKLKHQGRLTRVHELSRDQVEWTPAFEVDEVFRAYVELPDENNKYFAKEPQPTKSKVSSGGTEWYYVFDGDRLGPVSTDELAALVSKGEIKSDTLVWSTELADWSPVSSVPNLSKSLKKEPNAKNKAKKTAAEIQADLDNVCMGCGANMHPSASRCASCGKKKPTGKNNKRWIYISSALLMLLVILLVIGVVVAMQMNSLPGG